MTQFIVVNPGQEQIVASGPQYGVRYTLTSADGIRAVFNDPGDADYVGWLTGISGFDSPEVQESADDLIGDDGGIHGDFFYRRRPVVIEGVIDPRPSNFERNIRMTRLQRASNAMRRDSTLRWTVEGGVEQILYLRRQQPLRITGGYAKDFQLSMVSADPRIYSAEIREHRFTPNDHTQYVKNLGSSGTYGFASITGPATAIEVHNHTTGESLLMATGFSLSSAQRLDIDFKNKSVLIDGTTNAYGDVQFGVTKWWQLAPGLNNIAWHGTSTAGTSSMVFRWQDAWI